MFYVLTGVFGSLMFGDRIDSNIFTNYGCNLYMQILHVCYGIVVVIAFPLVVYPIRFDLQSLLKDPYSDNNTTKGYLTHVGINFCLTCLCLLCACLLDDIVIIFSFISAITGFMCLYYIPIMTVLKLPQSK